MDKIAQKVASRALLSKINQKMDSVFSRAEDAAASAESPSTIRKILRGTLFLIANVFAFFSAQLISGISTTLLAKWTGLASPDDIVSGNISPGQAKAITAMFIAMAALKWTAFAFSLYRMFYGKPFSSKKSPSLEETAQNLTPSDVKEAERFVNPDGSIDAQGFVKAQEKKIDQIERQVEAEPEASSNFI